MAPRYPWQNRPGLPGHCTQTQLQARIDFFGGLCWVCGVPYEAIDHVKPAKDGGADWPANLRPICGPCNSGRNALPRPKAEASVVVSTRAKRAGEALRLREKGLTYREIAEQMKLSVSYVAELVADPGGVKVQARKRSYQGVCSDCGAATDGSNGVSGQPGRCNKCASRLAGAKREVWTREAIVAAIQAWVVNYSEPPGAMDWDPVRATYQGHPDNAVRFRRGNWPTTNTVVRKFGSWNAAIAAAGHQPRAVGRPKRVAVHSAA